MFVNRISSSTSCSICLLETSIQSSPQADFRRRFQSCNTSHQNILKRQLIHVGAFNLSLIFRCLIGAGTPRELKNRLALLVFALEYLAKNLRGSNGSSNAPTSPQLPSRSPHRVLHPPHCHHSKV